MSNEYFVSLDVVWSTTVEADNEEEAIDKAIAECEYDNDASVEPYVCLREDMGKQEEENEISIMDYRRM